jgi:hypothetical protein
MGFYIYPIKPSTDSAEILYEMFTDLSPIIPIFEVRLISLKEWN